MLCIAGLLSGYLFGLFDRIAYFINSYFDLGIHERDVSFSSIWLSCHGKIGKAGYYAYKNTLDANSNIALASLYWTRKDFSDSFGASTNPYFKRIKQVRDAFEHKYVKIVDDNLCCDYKDGKYDNLVLYVSESEMYEITLNLLKILQESIICLALCINIEEKRKADNLPPNTMLCPINFIEYQDDWKI